MVIRSARAPRSGKPFVGRRASFSELTSLLYSLCSRTGAVTPRFQGQCAGAPPEKRARWGRSFSGARSRGATQDQMGSSLSLIHI
eukprot:4193260-Pyramimonas_sp.AAC.1